MSSSTPRNRGSWRSAGQIGPALLVVLVLLVSACTAGAPPSVAPVARGPLKVGILVPFTESAIDSDIGASQRRAADLYLKLKGGTLAGRDVQLVYNDESSLDPATNTVRIKQFLEQDHVQVLMGGAGIPAAYQLRDSAEAAKVVYIDTNASGNALTRAAAACLPSCKSTYVFRAAPSSWQVSEPLGEWEAKNGRRDWTVVLSDDTFGGESAAGFGEGLAKNGGHATGRITVPAKSGADWAKVIAGIRAQPSKLVFATFITDDAEGLIGAWSAAGMGAAGYTLAGPGPLADAQVVKATKQAALGVVTAFPWAAALESAENRAFVDAFEKAYRDEDTGQPLVPDGYAFEMWLAMSALEEGLKVAKGDANAAALIPALEAVAFKGPGGDFAFDRATHSATVDIYVREARVSGGAVVNAVVDRVTGVKDSVQ